MITERPTLDETLMKVAHLWRHRATCPGRRVGAILVRDGRQLAQGYNGSPKGTPHCMHPTDEPCRFAVHAEANVVATAARFGFPTEGAALFITDAPCRACAGLLINAGLVEVVFDRDYVSRTYGDGTELLRAAGIVVRRVAI